MEPELHPDLAALAPLLGRWIGEGDGEYPTIEAFRYGEEIVFEHVGDPFLAYRQSSWLLDADRTPLHLERGFWRLGGEGHRLEVTLAHPLGLTEVAEGTVEHGLIDVSSVAIGRTATGSRVTRLIRRYRVAGDRLTYELDMAMEGVPLTRHLVGSLRKAQP
jgi:THAP4-like, heme-binding beta-barrel domain